LYGDPQRSAGSGRLDCEVENPPSTQSGHLCAEIDRREAAIAGLGHGRGTSAASHCINFSGLITKCVVPSRHGVLSFYPTYPAALSCTRSSESASRVM